MWTGTMEWEIELEGMDHHVDYKDGLRGTRRMNWKEWTITWTKRMDWENELEGMDHNVDWEIELKGNINTS